MKKYGSRILAKDLFVDNDTRITGLNNNDLIVGPSGCGKTTGYVMPNLMQANESVIVQSLSQLEGRYGHARAMTIINNCDNCLYLGGQDVDTARCISIKANRSPNTILNMPLGDVWLFTRGQPPVQVQKYELKEHPLYRETEEGRGDPPPRSVPVAPVMRSRKPPGCFPEFQEALKRVCGRSACIWGCSPTPLIACSVPSQSARTDTLCTSSIPRRR